MDSSGFQYLETLHCYSYKQPGLVKMTLEFHFLIFFTLSFDLNSDREKKASFPLCQISLTSILFFVQRMLTYHIWSFFVGYHFLRH